MINLVPFDTWTDVLDHARTGLPLFYQAPLDPRPVRITIARIFKNGKLRINPPSLQDADPFTADRAHLDRFRRVLPKDPTCVLCEFNEPHTDH